MLASALHHSLFTEGLSLSSSCWTSCGSFFEQSSRIQPVKATPFDSGTFILPLNSRSTNQQKSFFFFQISRHGSRCESEAVIREEEEDGEQVS